MQSDGNAEEVSFGHEQIPHLILRKRFAVLGSFERSTIRDETSKSTLISMTSSLLKLPDTLTTTSFLDLNRVMVLIST